MPRTCLRTADSIQRTGRNVRFADPISTAQDAPAPMLLPYEDPDASCEELELSVRKWPSAKLGALNTAACRRNQAMQAPGALGSAKAGEKRCTAKPAHDTDPGLELSLVGMEDAMDDSSVVRYGSHVMAASGAVVLIPVAAVMLVSCVSVYVSCWTLRRVTEIGTASARRVLGLPAAAASKPAQSPPPMPQSLLEAPESDAHPPAHVFDEAPRQPLFDLDEEF